MMFKKNGVQEKVIITSMENLMPQNHLLREVEKLIEFNFIYEKVRYLYSKIGRKSIDPIILIKTLLIGYLYGINSERKLEKEIQVNIAFKWFLGLNLEDSAPDHSTMSQNRRRRFNGSRIFEEIFDEIVRQCINEGLVEGKSLIMDATHVKANASIEKRESVFVTRGPSEYLQRLEEEAQIEEKLHGKPTYREKNRKRKHEVGITKKVETKSITDPDAGWLSRKGKPTGFHYLCHQTADIKYGIITGIHVTGASENDHECCVEQIQKLKQKFRLPIKEASFDIGYDYAQVHQGLREMGITAYIPARDSEKLRRSDVYSQDKFQYDEENDIYVCPNDKILSFSHISRNPKTIVKIYSANSGSCKVCPLREKCISKTANFRTIRRPFFWETVERNHQLINTPRYKYLQKRRKCICEGNFALLKDNHNLRCTRKRRIIGALEHCLLSAIALNIKRLVKYSYDIPNDISQKSIFQNIKRSLSQFLPQTSFNII